MGRVVKKTLISILFISVTFSQNNISYTIYTDTKSYPDVTLLSVEGKGLIVNEKNGTRKYNIYIPYINRIKIIEGGSNPIEKPLGCVFGLSLGGIGGGLIGFGLYSQSSVKGPKTYASGYAGLIVPVAMLGGMAIGAWQGYKLGPSIGNMLGDSSYVSQNQLVNLRDKSLDEKINYLMSLINKWKNYSQYQSYLL